MYPVRTLEENGGACLSSLSLGDIWTEIRGTYLRNQISYNQTLLNLRILWRSWYILVIMQLKRNGKFNPDARLERCFGVTVSVILYVHGIYCMGWNVQMHGWNYISIQLSLLLFTFFVLNCNVNGFFFSCELARAGAAESWCSASCLGLIFISRSVTI